MASNKKVFFDTNVLVYQFDQSDKLKQRKAIELIEHHILNKNAVVSSQVVQEFINVALRKFSTSLSVPELELVMSELLRPLWSHVPNFDFYERAVKLYSKNSIGFYDALIVQAAMDLGCTTIYSEDLQDGQRFGTLVVKNPFA
jgi:predicted nucleic acid-binding protein